MKTDIKNLFNLQHFFKIVKSSNNSIVYSLKKPSHMLIKNVHLNWMQYIHSKTHKEMPIYLNKSGQIFETNTKIYGCIVHNCLNYDDEYVILEDNLNDSNIINKCDLKLELIMPREDAMQYFIKWQRYRKYWWSSISTTPSLFAVHDIKHEDKTANVDIVAQLPDGINTVENISIHFDENGKSSRLICGMSLKNALNVLLLDGLNNNTKEEYLRLHRKIAPYKISFAVYLKDINQKSSLEDLATLLHHKLESNNISSWLPDFTLPYKSQITENLHMGIPYTAILNVDVLNNGIFRLMNSSTMLGEQVHVADFHKYAAVIFGK